MNPVTIEDLEARWRPLSQAEQINAAAFLEDAWALVLTRRPNLEADIAAGTVSVGNVIRVVSAMVLRVLRNPEGKLQESIDDYSYRRDEVVSSGRLHITDDELDVLAPVVVGGSRFRSVRLVTYGDR